MRYLFLPKPDGDKVKDNVRGVLIVIADPKAKIGSPYPVLTNTDGIKDYVEPKPVK